MHWFEQILLEGNWWRTWERIVQLHLNFEFSIVFDQNKYQQLIFTSYRNICVPKVMKHCYLSVK